MKISGIHIVDTFGCREFKVGKFSAVRLVGQNASGKSSIIKALSYLFSGGTSPECIRKGAEKSVVSLDLDDGTKITKTTRPKRARQGGEVTGYVSDLEVTQPDGTPRPAPQSYINELGSALAVDPSTLLRIDATTVPGRRALAAELMKLVPIAFDPEEVNRACAYHSSLEAFEGPKDAIALSETPDKPLSLDDLKKAAAGITEQRRRLGITRDDTDGAIKRLQKSLPPEAPAGQNGSKLAELESMANDIERAVADRRVEIETAKQEAMATSKRAAHEASAVADKEYTDAVALLEARRTEAKRVAQETCNTAVQTILKLTGEELEGLESEARPHRERIAGELAVARERIEAVGRASTLKQEIEIQTTTCRDASWKYDQLSTVLQNLEALRLEKLRNLPVGGLVVEDGVPYLDGITWENVNLARRVEAVLQICCLQSGEVKIILWDDSEHGDKLTREAIEGGLVAAGWQVISAMVSDHEGLTIEVQ